MKCWVLKNWPGVILIILLLDLLRWRSDKKSVFLQFAHVLAGVMPERTIASPGAWLLEGVLFSHLLLLLHCYSAILMLSIMGYNLITLQKLADQGVLARLSITTRFLQLQATSIVKQKSKIDPS